MEEPALPLSSIPPLPEYPNQIFIADLPPEEWQACLDLWIYSIEYRLRVSPETFKALGTSEETSGFSFLFGYLQSASENATEIASQSSASDAKLRKHCHLLFRRICLESSLLEGLDFLRLYEVLCSGSTVFKRIPRWPETLQLLTKKAPEEVIASYGAGLHKISQDLSSEDAVTPSTFSRIQVANNLIGAAPEAGVVFMTGSDYLETLVQCYGGSMVRPPAEKVAKFVTEHAYICLRSLMKGPNTKMSMLIDHLYSLKASADAVSKTNPQQPTLISSIVCLTTLLKNLEINLGITPNARGQDILTSLQEYRIMALHLHPQTDRPRIVDGKGKGKAGPYTDMYMHKASQISQIHDLFPDLPTPYLLRLLDHYTDNVELVIGALLEPHSIPLDLQKPTKEDYVAPEHDHGLADLAPRSTPPLLPQKKSVFDNDDFDNLRISPTKVHRGRKDKLTNKHSTGDEHNKSKAAIMAALAAFDSDDDERDDTYDVADVGGTVDDTLDTDERNASRRPQSDPHEHLLFSAWKDSKELFARDSRTRLSQHRQKLKADTSWTDEQIEGWGLMLSRDPARETKLQQKYLSAAAFEGKQRSIGRTKWTDSRSGTATEEDDSDMEPNATGSPNRGVDNPQRMGTAGIRGARSFVSGRGGGAAGPPGASSTQAARKRKEQGRGRGGANHNRRDGRAKKVGRGMAGVMA